MPVTEFSSAEGPGHICTLHKPAAGTKGDQLRLVHIRPFTVQAITFNGQPQDPFQGGLKGKGSVGANSRFELLTPPPDANAPLGLYHIDWREADGITPIQGPDVDIRG